MSIALEWFDRPLLLVAHPDDESIACGGILQGVSTALVVFATDGAPIGYEFERRYGNLAAYSTIRFQEAARALGHVPHCEFVRLSKTDGSHFGDQRLFQELEEAAVALGKAVEQYKPDAIVSHTYEGGHIDHDACSFLASLVSRSSGLPYYEFPIYWFDQTGQAVFQKFRDGDGGVIEVRLTEAEAEVKSRMVREYRSQAALVSTFVRKDTELIRLAVAHDYSAPKCKHYPFQKCQLAVESVLRRFAQVQGWFESGIP